MTKVFPFLLDVARSEAYLRELEASEAPLGILELFAFSQRYNVSIHLQEDTSGAGSPKSKGKKNQKSERAIFFENPNPSQRGGMKSLYFFECAADPTKWTVKQKKVPKEARWEPPRRPSPTEEQLEALKEGSRASRERNANMPEVGLINLPLLNAIFLLTSLSLPPARFYLKLLLGLFFFFFFSFFFFNLTCPVIFLYVPPGAKASLEEARKGD